MKETKEFNLSIKREMKKASALKRWSTSRDKCLKAVETQQAYQDFVHTADGIDAFFKVSFAHAHDTFKMDKDLKAAIDILSDSIFEMEDLSESCLSNI